MGLEGVVVLGLHFYELGLAGGGLLGGGVLGVVKNIHV